MYDDFTNHVMDARKLRLNEVLHTLGDWCHARAAGDHNEMTTLTLLSRRISEIESSVNRAGWRAAAEYNKPSE